MKNLLSKAAVLLLLLSFPVTPDLRAQDQINTEVEYVLRIDNDRGFDFNQLHLFVQYQPRRGKAWKTIGSFVPNNLGRVPLKVPTGGTLSVQVLTSNPTVLGSGDTGERRAFFAVGKGGAEIIVRDEFRLPEDPRSEVRVIELTRAAAFGPCVPAGTKKGSVYFKPAQQPAEEGLNIWQFSDSASVNESIIGGLTAGLWEVRYYDNSENLTGQQLLTLTEGEILKSSCP